MHQGPCLAVCFTLFILRLIEVIHPDAGAGFVLWGTGITGDNMLLVEQTYLESLLLFPLALLLLLWINDSH